MIAMVTTANIGLTIAAISAPLVRPRLPPPPPPAPPSPPPVETLFVQPHGFVGVGGIPVIGPVDDVQFFVAPREAAAEVMMSLVCVGNIIAATVRACLDGPHRIM